MKENAKQIILFENKFLDSLTKVHPIVPICVFAPIIAFLVYYSYTTLSLSPFATTLYFLLGVLFWTMIEYGLHRFAFHYEAKSEFIRRTIYLIHGNHHDDPTNKYRSLMPPVPALIYAAFFWSLYLLAFGFEISTPVIAGSLFGYQCYDYLHYSIHQTYFDNLLWKKLRKLHLIHHKKDNILFGVTSPLWDYILGSK